MNPFPSALAIGLLAVTAAAQQPPFPRVQHPPANPYNSAKELLGKALFFEEQLSASRSVACATCHIFSAGGSDPRSMRADSLHPGTDGQRGTADDIRGSLGLRSADKSGAFRASPDFGFDPQVTGRRPLSVINAAFYPALFWDGRATGAFRNPVNPSQTLIPGGAALESQAAEPPTSPVEMCHMGETWTGVVERVQGATPLRLATGIPAALQSFVQNKSYADLFAQAFGSRQITAARISMAIATYERSLVSDQSPWDDFIRRVPNALTASQDRGRRIFFSQGANCVGCHSGPLFTDNRFHYIGLRPPHEDLGRFAITRNQVDQGRFRTASLRNVALRPPYFHHGGMRNLAEVVAFYNRGGDFQGPTKDPRIRPLRLSSGQQADLVAFLHALTDLRVAAETGPFDRPILASESPRTPQQLGRGTPGTAGRIPIWIAADPTFVGNTGFRLGFYNALGGGIGVLAADVGVRSSPIFIAGAAIHLPLSSSLSLIPAGRLPGAGAGQGHVTLALPIPDDSRLIGLQVGVQGLVFDAGASQGLAATPAVSIRTF